MSGTSYSGECPMCGGKNLICYSNWKPYDAVSGECANCGFSYYTDETQMSLDEVNEVRSDHDLRPLKKLKKQIYK